MIRADKRKYHYIYKITRTFDGKFYIGMHSTEDVNNGYFGSGKLITRSIKKHGIDKHTKEILEYLPSREELKLREKEIISKDLLENKNCMNLKLGGEGGWDHINNDEEFCRNKNSKAGKRCHELHPEQRFMLPKLTTDTALKVVATCKERYGKDYYSMIAKIPKTRTVSITDTQKATISKSLKLFNEQNRDKGIPHANAGIIREKVECPVCKKIGVKSGMIRWHFNNCKE